MTAYDAKRPLTEVKRLDGKLAMMFEKTSKHQVDPASRNPFHRLGGHADRSPMAKKVLFGDQYFWLAKKLASEISRECVSDTHLSDRAPC